MFTPLIFAPGEKNSIHIVYNHFLLQAFPVSQWLNGSEKSYASIEMTDDGENNAKEKDNKESEKGKDIIVVNINEWPISFKASLLRDFASENAIVLHHPGVNTPLPIITDNSCSVNKNLK